MRRFFLLLILGALAGMFSGRAQENEMGTTVVKSFEGTGSKSTDNFQVNNKWEVRWFSRTILSITVYSADHTVVAGTTGAGMGSFYLPTGGTYYLQIEGSKMQMPPGYVNRTPSVPNTGLMQTINGGDDNNNGNNGNNQPPRPQMPEGFLKWDVTVVELGSGNTGTQDRMSMNFVPPSAQVTPTPTPVANASGATPGKLTEDQARAVVLIKGDNGEGTGFLIKTPSGPVVVTNLHVLANNPNIKITTNSGAQIPILAMKGASDRDLAMLSIQDANYSYLDTAPDISKTAQTGDEVITPGNSEGGEVMLNTPGTVLGIGPQRVEFNNPIYHGNSGGPVFHTKSGKVLGVVTEAVKVDISNDLDKSSFASRNSAITGSMRYFGLRLDTVPSWIAVDWRRFQNETLFLAQFENQNRSLDSYLNTSDNNNSDNGDGEQGSGDQNNNNADANLYRSDEKIMKANDSYEQQTGGADIAQKLEALRGLLFDLQAVADTDMDQIQNMNNFYPFNQEQAKEELEYRKALKAELDSFGNNIERLGSLPRTNN